MEAGFSSLDLVQFRRQLLVRLPDSVNLPVHFALDYPTEEEVTNHLFEQLQAKAEPATGASGMWTLLNGRTQGTPIFLVGGVMGTVERPWGTSCGAAGASICRYARASLRSSTPQTNLEGLAAELRASMESTAACDAYTIGGLSFGAAVAFEMGLQLEREGKLARDP